VKHRKRPASGRFVLRLAPDLHAELRGAAAGAGLSLNDYCARKLALPSCLQDVQEEVKEAVGRATRLFEENLEGIAAFGSWARGESGQGSDLDLLVVLDKSVPLRRELYRQWDEQGRDVKLPLEPHFVHLPAPQKTVAGVWAEVALEGIILFERGFLLSKRLVAVRQDIASGRLVRRFAHGQPYWAVNEVA
jgi:hypothetical protein